MTNPRRFHRSLFLIMLLTLVIGIYSGSAQSAKKYKNYSEHHYKNLRYGFFKASSNDAGKAYPLIVYLHGSRDTVSRDMTYYTEASQKVNPCFILTPKCDEPNLGWGDTWHDRHSPAMVKVLSLVDSISKKYSIDINRLYLYGISMGGFGVFSVLQKEPGKFAAAYAICGGSSPDAAPKMLKTPLWIFHGEIDDVVPVDLSRGIYKEIIRLGGTKVKYTEYPGVKHNSWENVAKEKTLPEWLFSQRKNP